VLFSFGRARLVSRADVAKAPILDWIGIVAPWIVALPPTLRANWSAAFLFAVKLILVVLIFWGLYRKARIAISSWGRTIRLLGLQRTILSTRVIWKLRYREPFRYMRTNAPGVSMIFPLLLAFLVLSQMGVSWFAVSLLIMAALWLGVVWPSLGLVPPAIVWLSVSGHENFRILKKLQPIVPDMVKTLIDQASPDVAQNYYAHYMRLLRLREQTALGVSKLGSRAARSLAPLFMNPKGPRLESLRTRPGLWKRSVRELIDVAPIVIVDTRFKSDAVLEEVAWMLDPRRSFRAIWLGDSDGTYPGLETVLGNVERRGLIKCNEKLLYDIVQEMTHSSETLPRPGGIDWARRVEEMTAELDELLRKVRDKGVDSRHLDQLIWKWCKRVPDIGTELPSVSSSLDAALELIRRRLPDCSLTIRIFTNETAEVEIGVPDRAGQFDIYISNKEDWLSPARAALQALLKAERGHSMPGNVSTSA
jgi:hypothetical protein